MKKCPHYLEYTWGEPPLEPDGEGQRHKEFECKLAKHHFIAAECEGDITKCDLPNQLYKFLKEYRAKEKELQTEIKQLQAVREAAKE